MNTLFRGTIVFLTVTILSDPILANDGSVVRIGRDVLIQRDMEVDDVVVIGGDIRVHDLVLFNN